MIATASEIRSSAAAIEGGDGVFCRYRTELEWLALFVTADETVAEACFVDARDFAGLQPPAGDAWLIEWAGDATLVAAIQAQQRRIRQLASIYERHTCGHGDHAALPQNLIELAVAEAGVLRKRLDVLCRAALLLCGIKKRSVREAALLLGVSEASVSAAYCATIACLDVIQCELLREADEFAAICN